MECFDGLASLIVGENPLEVERSGTSMYRGSIYYGRRGVAIQAISAIDIALWDICGKAYRQPVHVLLGGKWRDTVRAYGSTLFRPTPEAMREAVRQYLDEGFTAVKFGWGVFGKDPGAMSGWSKLPARLSATIGTCWSIPAGSSSARPRKQSRWSDRSNNSVLFWWRSCCIRKTTTAIGRSSMPSKRGSHAENRKPPSGALRN